MKIGICVGHSRLVSNRPEGGAVTHDGKTAEWQWNLGLASEIEGLLEDRGLQVVVLARYQGASYASAMLWLAGELKRHGCDAAVELHFNSSDNRQARGHEWLHWHTSTRGKALALEIDRLYGDALPEIPRRGVKALNDSDRGALFVKHTHCPAVICEPFFGSNTTDWAEAKANKETIAEAIAGGIAKWAKGRL